MALLLVLSFALQLLLRVLHSYLKERFQKQGELMVCKEKFCSDFKSWAFMSKAESNEASEVKSNQGGLPAAEVTCNTDGDALKDSQGDQNSGWFEVKKKSRSSGKCNIHKSTSGKNLAGPYRRAKPSIEQNGRENHKVPIQQKESLSSPNEEVLTESAADNAKASSAQNGSSEAKVISSFSVQKESSICATGNLSTNATDVETSCASFTAAEMVPTLSHPPKFKWGNLDDEDLNQSNLVDSQGKGSKTLQVACPDESAMMKIEDSTISLEGGKQSSTKELNGLKNEESGKAVADFSQTVDAGCNTPENADALQAYESGVHMMVSENPAAEIFLSKLGLCEEVYPSKDRAESSAVPCVDEAEVLVATSDVVSEVAQDVSNQSMVEKQSGSESFNFLVEGLTKDQAVVQDVFNCPGYGVARSSTKQPMEFSVAASLLMGKFEETKSGESKERFRQRLWCYLFENLNRAIDELYFLCELECDMEQIQEALLVLKEAGMDFDELKSRVEGFEKIKKHPCPPQSLFGEGVVGSYPAKVEHRRPHAIAWEVRRMACSPHRAEILSSSLEAFKKVQQITAQKNLVSQSKRREASKLLDIEQTSIDLSAKQRSSINLSANRKESAPSTEAIGNCFAKVNMVCTPGGDKTCVQQRIAKPLEADATAESATCDAALRACETATLNCNAEVTVNVMPEKHGSVSLNNETDRVVAETVERTNKSTEKRVSIVDNQREKKTPKTRSSLDAWKVKRNWEDVLSSPLKTLTRPSRSPCAGWRSTERVKVLHDKLMSPERKRKSPMEMKKEVDEKQARATRIRRELENERVQRLQKTTEKLNRVSEWQAVKSSKLREGMHARQQRGESRHEAHLAEIARRAGDESSKVSEVRFITSLNEENKKLSLRQKLQDSELRRAERLQIIKIKQKEDMAREEAVLERRRIIEAERLQRLAEAQRKKEEAKARRDEERKAASAAREARAVEQVRKKEVRAKAQQEETEQQAQKLMEKLRESELRRKCSLEQIRERAAMESREQASPSTRLSLNKDVQPKSTEGDGSMEKELMRQVCGSKGGPKLALRRQALKRRVKKIRQRLMAKKYDFVEPPVGVEGFGIGSMAVAAAARSKIGRWLQDLQRFQLARKAGTSGVSFIVAEMIKYFDGKVAELHAARQAGLIDFIAAAIPASHTSKAEASQTTLSLLRVLKVLLALPANRSYFVSRNLLPPLIPILSTALENFSSQDLVIVTTNSSTTGPSGMLLNDEKLDVAGEVLNGLLECLILIINHKGADERQASMQDDLIELLTACEVIHHLRDLFSLFDRPQVEGAPFPTPVLFGLNLLQALTSSKGKATCDLQFSAMLDRPETARAYLETGVATSDTASVCPVNTAVSEGTTEQLDDAHIKNEKHQIDDLNQTPCGSPETSDIASVTNTADNLEVSIAKEIVEMSLNDHPQSDLVSSKENGMKNERDGSRGTLGKVEGNTEQRCETAQESSNVISIDEKGQMRQPLMPVCHSINFLGSAISETGLVGLPSLLTAVLLQTNPRSTPEQAAAVLPSNFEEVATCVLKVLNNLARLDLGLVQSLLAMPDLQMEFFHLVSFLLSHCTCKWSNSTDQVASLLLETLLLLGYFALLHPGNQAVLRWGKSPTILHKICDLPFAFFSDPSLMPALVGTLLAVCYGSEQNRDVVREELSMEMLLSLLKSSRSDTLADKDSLVTEEHDLTSSSISADATKEGKIGQCILDDDSIPAKEEIKRMIEDSTGSDSETTASTRQQSALRSSSGKSSNLDLHSSPNKRSSKNAARGNALLSSTENASQLRKIRVGGLETLARSGNPNTGPAFNKRQPISGLSENQPPAAPPPLLDCATTCADSIEPNMSHRPDLMLQNRFPDCLLDKAQDFFAAGL
ncbi:hypothetical protein GOP47_0007005 [Adiantum capillus-veneris]|uniref:S phase cyclin A-associated protein in the endoplasmic reticulum N-terminal domain-containing protein n=1 Tax=Adiantum capillus-veneris TaxID=13818 RepID=A0A9D4V0F1_ADICA|nr:hypothetical protein GOP47_0007005 [Adiantum capillus-veneris]